MKIIPFNPRFPDNSVGKHSFVILDPGAHEVWFC
jgi:hypothetical protein